LTLKIFGGGVSPADSKYLSRALLAGDPMEEGKSDVWKGRIWDKNGKGQITTEVKIKIK
jgi:hypothetical protein